MTQNNQGIDPRAAEWAVRLGTRDLTADERAELDQWLAADTRHRGALLRARAGWADLDRLAALAGLRNAPGADGQSLQSRWRVNRRFVVAASLTIVAIGSIGAWWKLSHRNVYSSDVGEVRRVALADGSSMILNTATEVTVNFDKSLREIQLTTGEGLFHVAKDPQRPFVVRAGPVSVRAVGTVFSVRALDNQVDVTVTEGVVELLDNSRPGDNVIRRVAANQEATVLERRQVEVQKIAHDEVERRLAWRDGMVEFSGEPLSAAVEEINRYNHRQIIVDDPALGTRPVVGLFRAKDPEGFAATVSQALGVDSATEGDAIHLRLK